MEVTSRVASEALGRLTEKYNKFWGVLTQLSESGELQKINGLTSVGHWGMDKGLPVRPDMGMVTERGQLFHAQGDNMEGSLYISFNDTVLRLRWGGDVALYLGSTANYVDVDYAKETEKWTLEPGRLHGEAILGIDDQHGVKVRDEALNAYEYEAMKLKWAHEDELAKARAMPQSIVAKLASIFGQSVVEPKLVLPEAPSPAYRPVLQLVEMLDTMTDGIERTTDILAPYVPANVGA